MPRPSRSTLSASRASSPRARSPTSRRRSPTSGRSGPNSRRRRRTSRTAPPPFVTRRRRRTARRSRRPPAHSAGTPAGPATRPSASRRPSSSRRNHVPENPKEATMQIKHVKSAVALGSLVALALVSSATGQSTTKLWTGDPVADRQRLMKLNGASWADAQAQLKAGNAEAVAANAETMALTSVLVPGLFPEGSLTDKSKAKPEIWQKWPEFAAAAKNLENRSATLRDQAVAKDGAAAAAAAATFGREACGTCHTPFRVPPPQQPPAQPRA